MCPRHLYSTIAASIKNGRTKLEFIWSLFLIARSLFQRQTNFSWNTILAFDMYIGNVVVLHNFRTNSGTSACPLIYTRKRVSIRYASFTVFFYIKGYLFGGLCYNKGFKFSLFLFFFSSSFPLFFTKRTHPRFLMIFSRKRIFQGVVLSNGWG